MRILHVTDTYAPCVGGIEMHVRDLATRQQAAGHDVRILTATCAGAGTLSEPVAVTRMAWNPLAPGTTQFIAQFVNDEKIDVVHIHLSVGSPLGWAALRAPMTAGRLATMHSVAPAVPRIVRVALKLSGIRAHDIVFSAVSDVAAAPMRAALRGVPVHVLPNGIDADFWTAEAAAARDDVFTMVSVGRFTRRKRIRPLIEIIARVQASLPAGHDFRVLIVGDGPQFGQVKADIARHGLQEHVELLGARTRNEIRTILTCADVYLAPARLESFGIAALEARCSGVPVIAMACSGVEEFISDGVEGFLVDDDAGMAETAAALAVSPSFLGRMRAHVGTTVPSMSWDRMLEAHDALYEEAMTPVDRRTGAYDRVTSELRS